MRARHGVVRSLPCSQAAVRLRQYSHLQSCRQSCRQVAPDRRRNQPLRETSGTTSKAFCRHQRVPCGQETLADGAGREASRLRLVGERQCVAIGQIAEQSTQTIEIRVFFGKLARQCFTPEGAANEKLPVEQTHCSLYSVQAAISAQGTELWANRTAAGG